MINVGEELEAIMATRQVPSIGRVVHYHSYGTLAATVTSEPRAAIITAVGSPGYPYSNVDLCVLTPSGICFHRDVEYSEVPHPGRWTWPPYVPAAAAAD